MHSRRMDCGPSPSPQSPGPDAAREVETADETELVFEGLCAFADPPKPTAAAAIARLAGAGVRLKILSGDDPVVVRRLAGLVGLNAGQILSGSDVAALSDDALAVQVQIGRRLWPACARPEVADRQGAAGQRAGRRLSRRRHQRCAGTEGRRYRAVGRRRNRRRAGRRRHDPAGVRSGSGRRRRRGRPAHLRQHPQICAHGRKLQFRQHAVDGDRVDRPAVPADVADADPAQQSALRSLGTRHPLRHRRVRRQRPGRNCGT